MASIYLIIDYIRRLIFNFIKMDNLMNQISKKIEDLNKKIFKENKYNSIIFFISIIENYKYRFDSNLY